jgi:hypothetical protein
LLASGCVFGERNLVAVTEPTDAALAAGDGMVADARGTLGTSLGKLTGSKFGTDPPWNNDPSVTFDKAFDGDITTYVDTTAIQGYAGLDLGAPAQVTLIRFFPRIDHPHRLLGGAFQCSTVSQTDGYSDLYTVSIEPPQAWTEVKLATAATCRYVRYFSPVDGHANIAEVEFWGQMTGAGGAGPTDAGAPLVNLSLHKPASASSERAGQDAAKGNDGLLGTSYSPTSGAYPVWWKVDLGATYPLLQSNINFDATIDPYMYRIETSVDGTAWSSVIDQTKNTTRWGGSVIDFFNANARYVRLTITGASASTTDWGSFKEFSVWGYGTPL